MLIKLKFNFMTVFSAVRRMAGIVVIFFMGAVCAIFVRACAYSQSDSVYLRHSEVATQSSSLPRSMTVGFFQDMLQHHGQAILMASMGLSKGGVDVNNLSREILRSQSYEMGQMHTWLQFLNAADAEKFKAMDWMAHKIQDAQIFDPIYADFIQSCQQSILMPGLASQDQIEALRVAPNTREFDKLFVELMINHHRGAVPMARFASLYAEDPIVRSLAKSMDKDQSNELNQLVFLQTVFNKLPR